MLDKINMGWSQMHWEKIPGQLDKDILKKQLDEATTEDIPVRLTRVRRKGIEFDGNKDSR